MPETKRPTSELHYNDSNMHRGGKMLETGEINGSTAVEERGHIKDHPRGNPTTVTASNTSLPRRKEHRVSPRESLIKRMQDRYGTECPISSSPPPKALPEEHFYDSTALRLHESECGEEEVENKNRSILNSSNCDRSFSEEGKVVVNAASKRRRSLLRQRRMSFTSNKSSSRRSLLSRDNSKRSVASLESDISDVTLDENLEEDAHTQNTSKTAGSSARRVGFLRLGRNKELSPERPSSSLRVVSPAPAVGNTTSLSFNSSARPTLDRHLTISDLRMLKYDVAQEYLKGSCAKGVSNPPAPFSSSSLEACHDGPSTNVSSRKLPEPASVDELVLPVEEMTMMGKHTFSRGVGGVGHEKHNTRNFCGASAAGCHPTSLRVVSIQRSSDASTPDLSVQVL